MGRVQGWGARGKKKKTKLLHLTKYNIKTASCVLSSSSPLAEVPLWIFNILALRSDHSITVFIYHKLLTNIAIYISRSTLVAVDLQVLRFLFVCFKASQNTFIS